VKFTLPWRTCTICFLPLLLGLDVCPWKDLRGWGQSLMKWDGRKLGRRPCCCCCWGCGVGGRLNRACWGGRATHLPDILFRGGARVAMFWTNRYLGCCAIEGPVGVFRFFSARWAEMQSSWVMAILTNSLKVSAFTRFSRSLSLVFRPRRKRSRLRVSVSA
jgi:hypothetical protein